MSKLLFTERPLPLSFQGVQYVKTLNKYSANPAYFISSCKIIGIIKSYNQATCPIVVIAHKSHCKVCIYHHLSDILMTVSWIKSPLC